MLAREPARRTGVRGRQPRRRRDSRDDHADVPQSTRSRDRRDATTSRGTDASAAARRSPAARVIYWWVEIIAVLIFYVVYSAVRNADAGAPRARVPAREAAHRAGRTTLGIYHEHDDPASGRCNFEPLIVAANYFYGSLHFVVTIGVGVFLFRTFPDDYPRWRNTLAIATALALIGFTLLPLMPPRLLPHSYGFVDTLDEVPDVLVVQLGRDEEDLEPVRGDAERALRWALWCACALVPRLKHWWAKSLAALYPVLTVTRDRDDRQPLLPRRGRRLHHLRHRLRRRARWITRAGPATRDAEPPRRCRDPAPVVDASIRPRPRRARRPPTPPARCASLVGRLGGTVFFGGEAIGFRPMQVRLGSATGDGMTIESLEAVGREDNDFLERFVARHGAGAAPPHVQGAGPRRDARARARRAGFTPVNIDVSTTRTGRRRSCSRARRTAPSCSSPRPTSPWTVAELLAARRAARCLRHARVVAGAAAAGPDRRDAAARRAAAARTVPRRSRSSPAAAATSTSDDADTAISCGRAAAASDRGRGPPAGVARLDVDGLDGSAPVGTRFVPVVVA